MSVRFRPVATLTVVALVIAMALPASAGISRTAPVAGTAEDPAAGCVAGAPADAAIALHGLGAELVTVDAVGALITVPVVHPGMRQRLLPISGDAWCPAEAINLVNAATGVTGNIARAEAAAKVLAAANFDGITVSNSRETAPGVVALTTHARTNGIVADWLITVDAIGIVDATWTATAFAVAPFEAQYEGLTALVGASASYSRDATGLVRTTTPLLADPIAHATPEMAGAQMVNVMSDDFTIYVNIGDAGWNAGLSGSLGVAPDPGVDAGDDQVDYLRIMSEAANVNYEDYLKWGLTQTAGQRAAAPGWNDDEGTIYVDGVWAAYCLACVFISEDYNVHMNRALHEALTALGYSYPDDRLAVINIVGHEMMHNFQNAYGKPDSVGGGRSSAYSEGVARFAESLHDYSHVSHQPGSLIYANDSNGCNGFTTTDAGFANGPLDGLGYHACQFWLAHYATYGLDSVVGILERTAGRPTGSNFQIYAGAIEQGTGAPMAEILANFAARTLTHTGYVWGNPVNPDSDELDWTTPGLERWSPSGSIGAPGTFARTLNRGGVAAASLRTSGTVQSITGGAAALVAADGTFEMLSAGDSVSGNASSGDYLVLINPAATTGTEVSVTIVG